MEFVVILGGSQEQAETVANKLRSHGYHHFSPELFFMDDFGDLKHRSDQLTEAESWCRNHAMTEMQHHHDVVINGVMLNPALIQKAQDEGYHLATIRLDKQSGKTVQEQVDALIAAHERGTDSMFQRLFGNTHS